MCERIIITTGYMGSGSSAATDLIAEYKNCQNERKSYEYIFLSCPNGLFDLEDKLRYGNNAFRSDEALKNFSNVMNDLYCKRFWWVGNYKMIIGDDFIKYIEEFMNEIVKFKFTGYWYWSEYPDIKMIGKLIAIKPFKLLFHKIHEFKKITRYNNQMEVTFFNADVFYTAAKKLIYQTIHLIAKDEKNVILDQLLLPFNLYRIDNYFNKGTYAIVVERDPRDVFILNKYIWNKKKISVPFPLEVYGFCEFYKMMRESEHKCDSDKVIRINFEDLIYNYEQTVCKIENHIGFTKDDHIYKRKRFDPAISIKNTQLFHKSEYAEEVKIIEEYLTEFLYDFPYKINNGVEQTVEFE